MQTTLEKKKRSVVGRAIICLVIILLACGGFLGLKSLKTPPAKIVRTERPLKVETISVHKTDVPVRLKGYGELKPIKQVDIAPEVAGRIVEIHPRLKAGEIIPEGELLFKINQESYQADYAINKERVAILEKDLVLAHKELSRVRDLYSKNKVGTAAGVELTEKTVNNAADRLALARLAMTRAKISYDNSTLFAPFSSRIVSAGIEEGQYVSPGKTVLTIADDSWLEVEVPLYSRDAVDWLVFSQEDISRNNWFGMRDQLPCRVKWTESEDAVFDGLLHRVSSYNAETRNVNIIIRVGRDANLQNRIQYGVPLVAGMFVSVEVPGRVMENVAPVPRIAVSFENSVYVVRDNRLYTVEVDVVRVQGDYAYIAQGLNEGDQVITTRLVTPLEGSKVQIVEGKGETAP